MNNSGSAAGDSAPTNLPTNAGILSATDAERNTRSGSSLDDSVNKSATALNVDGMQVSSGTSLGKSSSCYISQIIADCVIALIPTRYLVHFLALYHLCVHSFYC